MAGFDWSVFDEEAAPAKVKKTPRKSIFKRIAEMVPGSAAAGVGDILDMGKGASDLIFNTLGGKPMPSVPEGTADEDALYAEWLRKRTGAPKPQTRAERYADSAMRGVSGSVVAAPAAPGIVSGGILRNLAVEAIAGATGGLGAEAGGEVGGTPGAILGGIAGGVAGGAGAARATRTRDPIKFIMHELEGGGKAVTDSGGLTRFGVSSKGNPGVNIAKLTEAQARKLYQDKYFKPLGIDPNADDAFKTVAFDTAINHGVGKAKQLIAASQGDPGRLLELRKAEYARLIAANPKKYGKYEKGWANRLGKLEDYTGTQSGGLEVDVHGGPGYDEAPLDKNAELFQKLALLANQPEQKGNTPIDLGDNTNRLLQMADDEIAATRADTERFRQLNADIDAARAGNVVPLNPPEPEFTVTQRGGSVPGMWPGETMHKISVDTKDGRNVEIDMTKRPDGSAQIDVSNISSKHDLSKPDTTKMTPDEFDDYFTNSANDLGPAFVRSVMKKIQEQHPDIKRFTGLRISGARGWSGKGAGYATVPARPLKSADIIDLNGRRLEDFEKTTAKWNEENIKKLADRYWEDRHVLDAIKRGERVLTRDEAEEHLERLNDYISRNWNDMPPKMKEIAQDMLKQREEMHLSLGGRPSYSKDWEEFAPASNKQEAVESYPGLTAANTNRPDTFGEKVKAFIKDEEGSLKGDEPEGEPKPRKDMVGNLNLDRIAAPEEVKEILRNRAFETGQLGTQSWDETETKALAFLQDMTPADLIAHDPVTADLPAYSEAIRTLNLSTAKRIVKLANDILDPEKNTPAVQKEFADMLTLGAAADARRSGVTANVARALAAHKRMIHNPIKGFELSEHLNGKPEDVAQIIVNKSNSLEEVNSTVGKMGFGDHVANVFNLPRTLMSSFDLSAPLRQGVFMITRPEFYKAFGSMFKQISEKGYNAVQDEIMTRPSYKLMKESGLAITDAGSILSQREEQFMSRMADKIPGIKHSQRAYTGFLNRLRADTFDSLMAQANRVGNTNPQLPKQLSNYINNVTGRGDLGKLNASVPALSTVFFSPRLIMSRAQILNPNNYVQMPGMKKIDPFVRKQAWRDMFGFAGAVMTMLGLAHLAGAETELNPKDSDFAKIKVGNTRYDITGGISPYVRFAAQWATDEKVNSRNEPIELGKGYRADTANDLMVDFLRNKLAPVPGLVWDAKEGKDPVGKPVDFKETDPFKNPVGERLIPLIVQDMKEGYDMYGAEGIARTAPSMFGVGVQNYAPRPDKRKTAAAKSEFDFEEMSSGFDWGAFNE